MLPQYSQVSSLISVHIYMTILQLPYMQKFRSVFIFANGEQLGENLKVTTYFMYMDSWKAQNLLAGYRHQGRPK